MSEGKPRKGLPGPRWLRFPTIGVLGLSVGALVGQYAIPELGIIGLLITFFAWFSATNFFDNWLDPDPNNHFANRKNKFEIYERQRRRNTRSRRR